MNVDQNYSKNEISDYSNSYIKVEENLQFLSNVYQNRTSNKIGVKDKEGSKMNLIYKNINSENKRPKTK